VRLEPSLERTYAATLLSQQTCWNSGPSKVGFKLLYLSEVRVYHVFLDVAHIVDLVNDDLVVIVSYELLDP
jgi:hypothetical protein